MRLITTVALGLVLVGVGLGQVGNSAKLRVSGVGLGSTQRQVTRALGKAVKDGPATVEGCIGAREKMVEYAGLSFYMMDGDSEDGKTFEVKAFEVTGGKWVVSGVKIGDAAASVRAKFGRKYTVRKDEETGQTAWEYEMGEWEGPGMNTVYFTGGRVVKISSLFLVC